MSQAAFTYFGFYMLTFPYALQEWRKDVDVHNKAAESWRKALFQAKLLPERLKKAAEKQLDGEAAKQQPSSRELVQLRAGVCAAAVGSRWAALGLAPQKQLSEFLTQHFRGRLDNTLGTQWKL